jgi:hypothetical protein
MDAMKITRSAWRFLAMVAVFLWSAVPLSYSEDGATASSHQRLTSVVNLSGESSANAVIRNDGVIEFQANELIDSVAKKMVSNGTLPPDSTLARKNSQVWKGPEGMSLDALVKDATKITQEHFGVPLNPTLGAGLGTGVTAAKKNPHHGGKG